MRAFVLIAAILLALTSPARADDVGAAQDVIRAQEQAFADLSEEIFPSF